LHLGCQPWRWLSHTLTLSLASEGEGTDGPDYTSAPAESGRDKFQKDTDLGTSRKKALEYAYSLLERPRAHLRVELAQIADGVVLRHNGRLLTKVYLNHSGMNAAAAMAEALGVRVPPLGKSASTLASTGLLYRVLAISQIDFRNEAAFEVAANLVEEAVDMQRGGSEV
jgi:hypothetical protein